MKVDPTTGLPGYFNLIFKQPIDTLKQLAGKKIGATSNNTEPFANSVGAAAALIPAPEVYTALERGVVDAYSYPFTNSMDAQLYQVCKYPLDHPDWSAGSTIIISLDSSNKLSPNLQTMMIDIAKEAVAEYMNDFEKELAAARQKGLDNGMKFTKFTSQADIDLFYKQIYDQGWAENTKRCPDVALKMREMLTRKK